LWHSVLFTLLNAKLNFNQLSINISLDALYMRIGSAYTRPGFGQAAAGGYGQCIRYNQSNPGCRWSEQW